MTENEPQKPQPEIWVKVVEAHALKTWIGLILASSYGLTLVAIAVGAVINTLMNPEVTDLSSNNMTLLASNMGALIAGLIGFITGQALERKKNGTTHVNEGELTLKVDPPPDSPPPTLP